ncbi:MAG: hypothetical protein LUG66_11325 [Clostridiales bacterium]|nr:hypothetical protein [Clostridiales bacterium]
MKKKIGIIWGTIIVCLLPIAEYLTVDCCLLKKFNLYSTAFSRPHILFHAYILYILAVFSFIAGFMMKYRFVNKLTYRLTENSGGLPKAVNNIVSTVLSAAINAVIPFIVSNIINIIIMASMLSID